MNESRIVIAQITDSHIRAPGRLAYCKVDTAHHLAQTVALLAAPPVPVDAVIVTGDLTDFAADEEYAHFRKLVSPLSVPIYPVPGNHDERAALRRAFADLIDLPAEGPQCHVADVGRVRVAMVDSTVPGAPHGEMTATTLAWLDRVLAEAPERPTLVALHHPPFLTGVRHMDVQNCRGADALEELLRRHPNVCGLTCGHVHRTVITTFAGQAAMIAPSPAHAVSFDLAADAPPSFSMEPPAVLLHVWGAGSDAMTTHWLPVGRSDGPYPFFDDAGRLID
ncbi:phosphodiesterase [Xanthobacteraceae bacterium Astr-EGSB]|uniref:phosphodiesterase n=1 Tax=Astrobacterium formosum TaxID=3069710 RepID=UPI0027B1201A|nr:phosphodiesterase [Xanthobacteraceae bacterium Astr-EGSB]